MIFRTNPHSALAGAGLAAGDNEKRRFQTTLFCNIACAGVLPRLDLHGAAVPVRLVVPLVELLRARDPVQLELAQRVVRPRVRVEAAGRR